MLLLGSSRNTGTVAGCGKISRTKLKGIEWVLGGGVREWIACA